MDATVSWEKDPNGIPFIQLGENVLRFEEEELDEEYRERALLEMRETKENVENAMRILRESIEGEKNLHVPLDEEFLLKYLRPCKFHPDSAFKIMRKFYKVKLKHPKYFVNLLPTHVAKVFGDGILYFLPKRCRNGARIMVMSLGRRWDTKQVTMTDFIRAMLVAVKIAMDEPKTQVGGVHVVLDMEGLAMSHIWLFTPGMAKLIIHVVTECLPIRLLGYNIINQSVIFDVLFNVFKPFLSDKIKNRAYFHGKDWASLHEKVDAECLPVEWGGTLRSPECPGRFLNQLLEFYECRYEKVLNYGYVGDKIDADARLPDSDAQI